MEEDIDEIRALRMNAMDYNADEDVSYVVDADALNKVQSNVSEATQETLSFGTTNNANNNALIPVDNDRIEQNLHTALIVNQQYQATLLTQLNVIDAEMERNKELQKRYKDIIYAQNARPSRKAPINNIGKRAPGFPYFTDQDGQKPPDNDDTLQLKPELAQTAYAFKYRKWSKSEIASLAQNIRGQNSATRFDKLLVDLESNNISADYFAVEQAKMLKEKDMPNTEAEMNIDVNEINWDGIAASVGGRTAPDCKVTWINAESPKINKDPWTKDEDNKLVKLVKQYKGFRWETVARELGTNRVAIQCIRRYQRNLNTHIMKAGWSKEDDRILGEAIKKYGATNWQQVANCLEGKTGQQCLHRWDKTLKPNIKKGRWSAQEDQMLIDAVNTVGEKTWIKICKLVPGRTDMQCRERYMNVLNPAIKHTPWTPEEDARLEQGIAIHGLGQWTKIATVVVTRTDNQCWRRWKSMLYFLNILEDVVDEYREAIGKKKAPSRRKSKKADKGAEPEELTEEQELKRVAKRRKTDFKNARKGNKAVSDGIQSAIEPEEIINIRAAPEEAPPAPPAPISQPSMPPPSVNFSIAVDPQPKRRGRPASTDKGKSPASSAAPTTKSPSSKSSSSTSTPSAKATTVPVTSPINVIPRGSSPSIPSSPFMSTIDPIPIASSIPIVPTTPVVPAIPAPIVTTIPIVPNIPVVPTIPPIAPISSTPTLHSQILQRQEIIEQQVALQQQQANRMRANPIQALVPLSHSSSESSHESTSTTTSTNQINLIPVPISSRRKHKRIIEQYSSDEEEEAEETSSEESYDDDSYDDESDEENEAERRTRRDLNRKYDATSSSLPIVYPSPTISFALYRLLEGMATFAPITNPNTTTSTTSTSISTSTTSTSSPSSNNNNDVPSRPFESLDPYVHLPEFKLLTAWFNSLFLCSLLVADIAKNPTPIPSQSESPSSPPSPTLSPSQPQSPSQSSPLSPSPPASN